ncbi:MAG: glycosyltransferase family 4 protein [Rhodothermales bacterium]
MSDSAKRIGMVLDAGFPHDPRVSKEGTMLADLGYEVHLICTRRNGEDRESTYGAIRVHRLDVSASSVSKGLRDISIATTWKNGRFESGVSSVVRDCGLDALHVHDLPLAATCKSVADRFGIPLILDLHENYPEGLDTWFRWRKSRLVRFKNRLFFNYDRWSDYEKWALENADQVVVVVQEMQAHLIRKHTVPADKFVVVSNAVDPNFIAAVSASFRPTELRTGFNITYVGGFGPHRGLDTAIRAMPRILEAIPDAYLNLVGFGHRDVEERLRKLARETGCGEAIVFHGRVEPDRVVGFMKFSDLNVIPHASTPHTENTVPHKLYQIMLSGRPLLVSSCAPLKRIVEEADCGYVFDADDASSFARRVISIHANPDEVREKSARGPRAASLGPHSIAAAEEALNVLYNRVWAP